MTDETPESSLPRRGFLRGAAATGLALGATGRGAATAGDTDALNITETGEGYRIENGTFAVTVRTDPFGVTFGGSDSAGPTGLGYETSGAVPKAVDPHDRYGTLGFAVGARQQFNTPMEAWGIEGDVELRWVHATRVTDREETTFTVETADPTRTFSVTFYARGDAIGVDASLSDETGVVKTGWSFARPKDVGARDDRTGERFLGFGERSDGVDQTGSVVENWAEEGPYSAGMLKPVTDPTLGERWQGPEPVPGTNYPIPWFVSSRGYGFLLESTYYNSFRLATDRADAWHVETWEPHLEYVVYPGPTPADALARFSGDTGRQPEPAEWFFGPWFQAAGSDEFREELTRHWREWDVPVTVRETSIHYLPCGDHVGEREFHRRRTERDHERGYKVTAYVNSFVCENHPNGAYTEGNERGYFLQTPTGDTYPVPYFAYFDSEHRYHGVVDFTNPDAETWWHGLIAEAVADGYDGWMEDFGEYVPPNSRSADGRTGFELHNRYPTLYHRASHRYTWPKFGREFAQFVRAGYTRTAQYARIVWGGDPNQDYSKADGLAAAVSQGQSMGLSGVAYWRTDIGGFVGVFNEEKTDEELFVRWLQYGAFNGLMSPRARGYPRPRDPSERAQPWHEDVRPIWRKFCKLRTQLFPYIWDAATTYQDTGLPMVRHLALHYPDDPEVYASDAEYQFLFGRDVLVAPVITEGARERELYLPEGEAWINFWDAVIYDEETGAFERRGPVEAIEGGQYVTVDAPLGEVPLFVRAGAQLELLPPEVETLAAPEGVADEVTTLAEVDDRRTLAFPTRGADREGSQERSEVVDSQREASRAGRSPSRATNGDASDRDPDGIADLPNHQFVAQFD